MSEQIKAAFISQNMKQYYSPVNDTKYIYNVLYILKPCLFLFTQMAQWKIIYKYLNQHLLDNASVEIDLGNNSTL